ncbi:50S ribosomal protein L11 methyltransferase [Actinomadura spongiicola]|uniref:50S ribosomal protein L11 methyltransferase n=1 Tax=Actinomadura spongiicola TaxID=2303421 RepID=UPI00131402B0|nr:50S ribosomal protein L11 methyltransferase [Actinomadura spongiicola]
MELSNGTADEMSAYRTESLLEHGTEAMGRGDYSTAATMFAIAGGSVGHGYDRQRVLYNRAIRNLIPRWHYAMLNDDARNAAYRDAIRHMVRPGDLVLDIGTGAGLLSLLAIEAGAEAVVTCEMEPRLADVARQIMINNKVQSKVTVVSTVSTDLRVGVDLPRRADVLVTEIFDCALFGEGAVPAIRHARRDLLRPDARIIPGRARVLGQLIESEELLAHNSVSEVLGFDLSPFQRFRSIEYFSTYLSRYRHRPLSDPFVMFDVDFRTGELARERRVSVPVTATGDCHAVAMWFDLDLASGVTLSNSPDQVGTHWRQAVQTLERPVTCQASGSVDLLVAHDEERVLVRGVEDGRPRDGQHAGERPGRG